MYMNYCSPNTASYLLVSIIKCGMAVNKKLVWNFCGWSVAVKQAVSIRLSCSLSPQVVDWSGHKTEQERDRDHLNNFKQQTNAPTLTFLLSDNQAQKTYRRWWRRTRKFVMWHVPHLGTKRSIRSLPQPPRFAAQGTGVVSTIYNKHRPSVKNKKCPCSVSQQQWIFLPV